MDKEEELDKWETEFKRGFSKPFILLVLEGAPTYPFDIIKKINKHTAGKISIQGSNIYPVLRDLEKLGLIASEKEEKKKNYRLTTEGKNFLDSLKKNMAEFVDVVEKMIENPEE